MAAAILAEEVTRSTILLRVLIWNEQIEDLHNLTANSGNVSGRHDENKIIAADVADESELAGQSPHAVMEDSRQNPNDTNAFTVAVPVVVFLEVVEIGVAYGKSLVRGDASVDFRFDRSRTGKARGWMYTRIAVGALQHHVETPLRLHGRGRVAYHLVRTASERSAERLVRV